MTTNFNSARPPRTMKARRRTPTVLIAAGAVMLSSCGLPFADEGQDISADVEVSGAAPENGGASTRTEAKGDETASNIGQGITSQSADEFDDDVPAEEVVDPAPALEVDTRFNGRSTTYLGIEIEVGDLIVTSQSIDGYVDGTPPTDDDSILIVELAVTNRANGAVSVPEEVLGIRLANGDRIAVADIRTPDGDAVYTMQPAAQSTERVLVVFPDVDLVGSSLEVSEAGRLPQSISFDPTEPVGEASFALALEAQPAVAGLRSPSGGWTCDYLWDGRVANASVELEGVDGSRLERAAIGERWVAIELEVSPVTPQEREFFPCYERAMPASEIAPRLVVNGAAMAPSSSPSFGVQIEHNATDTVLFWFRIPADTPIIELTDVNGMPIAQWALALPSVPGES